MELKIARTHKHTHTHWREAVFRGRLASLGPGLDSKKGDRITRAEANLPVQRAHLQLSLRVFRLCFSLPVSPPRRRQSCRLLANPPTPRSSDTATRKHTLQTRLLPQVSPADPDDVMRWLTSLAGYVAPIFLILSPVLSYSDQAMAMHRNKSSAGFSLDIPLIMLIASMFRYVASD